MTNIPNTMHKKKMNLDSQTEKKENERKQLVKKCIVGLMINHTLLRKTLFTLFLI